jgi:putative glycosyltransferase
VDKKLPARQSARPAISVVATLYRSQPYVAEFCQRAAAAARQLAGDDYEIVLVNDGSPDDSLAVSIEIAKAHPQVSVVDLSRNFGHHKAMMTGLMHARGRHVFLIDSDLEEDPEWLTRFDAVMREHDCDVVYGAQAARKGAAFERVTGRWFYKTFNALTGINLPENITVARLMTRRYVDALLRHEEREIFMAGLWQITGFRQVPVTVTKHHTSASTYSLRAKVGMLVNSVTSFSNAPLHAIFYIGALISSAAALATIYLVVQRFLLSAPLEGWTSVMVSVWLIGGLMISFLGVIGIYLAKIFEETKRRPYTIVRRVYGQRHGDAENEGSS